MKFWSETVKPNKPTKVSIEDGFTLRLTQCSLGDNVQAGRSVLKVKVGGKSCVIASLIGDKMEHCVMELMFEEGEIEFSVTGKNEMHLAGNMMDSDDEDQFGAPDMDMDDEDEDDEDDEEDAPPPKGMKKAMMKQMMAGDEDDDDDDEEEGDEDDEEEGDEDDDDEEEDDDEDDDEEEDAEPAPKAGAKRPAAAQAKAAPTKQAKVSTPAGKKGGEAAKTPSGSAAKSPAGTPGTPKDVPSDLKAKVRQVLAKHGSGIKAADFPREYQKLHNTPLKDAQAKAGFKKMTEMVKSMPDVVKVKEEGGNMTFTPAKK
eukprot:CAMPEP_0177707418 /NCGR_PEP_ID=MMETSP0484_2-20121128/9740_1 /TAXON_ID=354590 /ORGANISM="Rhodomonas lens, Strain RHODO" /LENGTH=313 /DNA_ID=CAMNT_0019218929 /DNA_START=37 /DNA_END=978 /DNA_ORIENTATION=+